MNRFLTAFTLVAALASQLSAQLDQYDPAVSFDGTNFLVAWWGEDSLSYHVYCSRVTESGVVLDPDGFLVCTHNSNQADPKVAFDGTNYLVVWWDNRNSSDGDVYGARVSPDGTVLDPDGFGIGVGTGGLFGSDVCFGGSCYLVVWYVWHEVGEPFDVLAARVSLDGVLLDSVPISVAVGEWSEQDPCVGFDGTNFLVAWADKRCGVNGDIYVARVSQAGTVLDPDGIAVCSLPSTSFFSAAGFADNYLVVWNEEGDILGARVTTTGVLLDSIPFSVCSAGDGQWMPALAFDGTNFLVAWIDEREPGDFTSDIYAGRVTPAGVALDPDGFPVGEDTLMQRYPSVAFGTTCYLVAWDDQRNLPGNNAVYAARVTPARVVLDTLGIQIVRSGVEEALNAAGRTPNCGVTILNSILHLPEVTSGERLARAACLLDISGRKKLDLRSGLNDVSHLAPGVYFVRETQARSQAKLVSRLTIAK